MAGRKGEFSDVTEMEPNLLPLLKTAFAMAKDDPEIAEGLRKLNLEGQIGRLLFEKYCPSNKGFSNAA